MFKFYLVSILKRIFALMFSPLCIISLVLGFLLAFFVLLFDVFLFIFYGKFKLLDYYFDFIYPIISFGWFIEFTKFLNL